MQPDEILLDAFTFCTRHPPQRSIGRLLALSPADWNDLYSLAQKQGMTSILYHCLDQNNLIAHLPESVVSTLHQAYLSNAARNLFAERQAAEIISAFQAFDIQLIPLKGLLFSAVIYENPALRSMSDLDFLIQPRHTNAAQPVMHTLGYAPQRNPWEGPSHHLPPFYHPAYPFPIELHTHLTPNKRSPSLPVEFLWQCTQPANLFGQSCRFLTSTLNLLHTCQHGANQHIFSFAARTLLDIDTFLRNPANIVDWEQFWQLAGRTRCQHGTALLFALAQDLLSTPIPDPARQRVSNVPVPGEIKTTALAAMLLAEEQPDSPPPGWQAQVGWWLAKAGNLTRQIWNQPVSLRRVGYLIKDNMRAARNQSKMDSNLPQMSASRKLRGWLHES